MNKQQRMYQQIEKHGKDLMRVFGLCEKYEPCSETIENSTTSKTYGEKTVCLHCGKVEKAHLDPIGLCKKLRRLEVEASRKMVDYCNGAIDGDEIDAYQEKLVPRILKVIGKENLDMLKINRDPRGYTLKLTTKASHGASIHKDWGGYGILAPDFNE